MMNGRGVRAACLWVAALAGCSRGGSESSLPPPSSVSARDAARSADSYMVYYGAWDEAKLKVARTYPLVIVNPTSGNMTRDDIASIQGGGAIVLGYISVGEDLRTAGLTDAQMRADPRFVGDGTGPRMDPRGPAADGQPLAGIDPLGLPSNGGTGYASWYLNDNSVHNSPAHLGDGIPDRNQIFNACFANAGDPKWFDALENMTLDGPDRVAGFREILTTSTGRGLGCDGVFLDTIDTCCPNFWTSPSSPNESKFEWTAPGFGAFIRRVRQAHPDAVLLQNRGLFFFDPRRTQYPFNAGASLDFVFFESYRLNSGSTNNPDPFFYPDNRYQIAPKLMAEAGRPGGFRVLSLGYAAGDAAQMSPLTLVGQSTLGYDSLVEDIRVAEELAGFRHYLTDPPVALINTFVRDHPPPGDASSPVWTSTYNPNVTSTGAAAAPTPRVGIQEVVAGPGSLTVRWDVALDRNRVGYALYYQTRPFDFVADPNLASATRHVLTPGIGQGYGQGVGPGVYPYEETLSGLAPGQPYYLVIRAFDSSPSANEEKNPVVLSGTPH